MLFKGGRLRGLFGLIVNLRFHCAEGSGSKRRLADFCILLLAWQTMIIKTGLSYGDNLRVFCHFLQLREEILAFLTGRIRMNPDRGIDLRITFSQLDRFPTRLQSRADRNNAAYAGFLRSEQDVVEVFRKLRKV